MNVGASTALISSSQFATNGTAVALAGGWIVTGCDNFFGNNTTDITGGALTNNCVK